MVRFRVEGYIRLHGDGVIETIPAMNVETANQLQVCTIISFNY